MWQLCELLYTYYLLTYYVAGLLYMLHKGYCEGAFPMHDKAGDNDPGRNELHRSR